MSDADVSHLIEVARSGDSKPLGELLQVYRNYLTVLATTQMNGRLHRRVSPSDVVQETMMAAHRDFEKFRGSSEREFLGWLRQVLINTIHHTVDAHLRAQRRDLRREVSIEQMGRAMDQSAANLGQLLADPGPSPSEPVRRAAAAVALADRLTQMRPQYRDVIILRTLQGLPFEEVAKRMDRTPGATRMLWLRAIEKFKQTFNADV